MSIELKTRKMLWGRAANRCSFSTCRRELVVDSTETDDESLVGEECHMVAKKPDGPRGDSPLTSEQRDKYANLLLLCRIHHKVIDDQVSTYNVERLTEIKSEHERWVRESLEGFDAIKQREDEQYAEVIEELYRRIDIDNWINWSSYVMGGGGVPRIHTGIYESIDGVREWLLSRIWPNRYPEIESSIHNFLRVLCDFIAVFSRHSIPWGDKMLTTEKFYKIDRWDDAEYHRLARKFEIHTALVQDLFAELTRAINYVSDAVRRQLHPTFRIDQGIALITHGPYADFSYRTSRCEYRADQRTTAPYPGLAEFRKIRKERDLYFGD